MKKDDLLQKALSGAISEDELIKECYLLPVHEAIDLIKNYGFVKSGGQITAYFKGLNEKYPKLVGDLKERLNKEQELETSSKKD